MWSLMVRLISFHSTDRPSAAYFGRTLIASVNAEAENVNDSAPVPYLMTPTAGSEPAISDPPEHGCEGRGGGRAVAPPPVRPDGRRVEQRLDQCIQLPRLRLLAAGQPGHVVG